MHCQSQECIVAASDDLHSTFCSCYFVSSNLVLL
uniref:Uncharacterized protein n=1 Tax=Rhizophora mucronata TaxID=61149 RepID=A0A2P2QHM1_RHIMU